MKLGAENKTKVYAAAGLMALAVIFIARSLFSTGAGAGAAAPVAAPPVATSASRPSASPSVRGGKKVSAPRSLDPTLRYDLLKLSEATVYAGSGRNIFSTVEIPTPAGPANTDVAKVKPAVEQGPPLPPPPPPINLKFFGFASKPGEPKKVFLVDNEDVFIAAEGEIVDRRYKVVRISPMSVEIEDVLNNNRQSIPLTQG